MIFEFEQYKIDVNVEATRKRYVTLPLVTENCTCQGCENYLAAIRELPPKVLAFFDSLGLDIKKPAEVYGDLKENGDYFYGGFYHIAGIILYQKKELYSKIKKNHYSINQDMKINLSENYSVWFENDCALVPKDFPTPYFQIEISAILPWVLERPYLDDSVKLSDITNIKEGWGVLIDKKIEKTIFGEKYTFVFLYNEKTIGLIVGKALFDFYSVGWTGAITFVGKRLTAIR